MQYHDLFIFKEKQTGRPKEDNYELRIYLYLLNNIGYSRGYNGLTDNFKKHLPELPKLSNPNKVSAILKNLENNDFIRCVNTKKKDNRKYYTANPEPFFHYIQSVKKMHYSIRHGLKIFSKILHDYNIIYNPNLKSINDYIGATEVNMGIKNELAEKRRNYFVNDIDQKLKFQSIPIPEHPMNNLDETFHEVTNKAYIKTKQENTVTSFDTHDTTTYILFTADFLDGFLKDMNAITIINEYFNEVQIKRMKDMYYTFQDIKKFIKVSYKINGFRPMYRMNKKDKRKMMQRLIDFVAPMN